MKRIALSIIPLLLLSSCWLSKNPSSFVGSWKTGEQGFFSTAVVIVLKSNGAAEINAAFGIFASTKGTVRWRKEGDKLIFEEAKDKVTEVTILGKTDTTMTLRGPDGSITTYTKIGDAE
jgi:hypothetical protein